MSTLSFLKHPLRTWLGRLALGGSAVLFLAAGTLRAEDTEMERLKARLEKQEQLLQKLQAQNEYLQSLIETRLVPAGGKAADGAAAPEKKIDEKTVETLAAEYLKAHPGAGMPSGVQCYYGNGFTIRSTPNPKYDNWHDDLKGLPFELRIKGRAQLDYYNYHQNTLTNHQTNQNFPNRLAVTAPGPDQFAGVPDYTDFSALEVKRLRLIFEGCAFDPDLKYKIQLNGDTRGLGGFFNNNQIVTGDPGAASGVNLNPSNVAGGGVTIDHALRLFEAYVSYDWRPGRCKDCCPDAPNCGEGLTYTPTYTLIGGKMKPLFGLEEYLGSGNEQFVEFSMANWFFDAEDDNLYVAAGLQIKALQDRLFAQFLITNGSESNFSASQIDDYPGFLMGMWYDFGGTWNENKKAWDLFGDCVSDIDYSRCPVVRVGGAANIVPMDRRVFFGDPEQSRYRTVDGGARIIDVLNGAGDALNAVDKFDAYSFNTFAAAKYRGFSLSNEWWFRYLNNFSTVRNDIALSPGQVDVIKFLDGGLLLPTGLHAPRTAAVFPVDSLFDFGTQVQGGYFVIPTKLELVARWSSIWGKSGNINGDGTASMVNGLRYVNGAFRHFENANEYTAGVNYYWRRQNLKWQTDFSIYSGGNPAAASAAGFLTNRDGYLFRTQLQLAF